MSTTAAVAADEPGDSSTAAPREASTTEALGTSTPHVERDLNQGIVNNFYNAIVNGAPTEDAAAKANFPRGLTTKRTGTLAKGHIDELMLTYVAPVAAEAARKTLLDQRCVVLVGPQGCGRQSGAIALLHDIGISKTIVLLPPGITISELAGRTYSSGCVYIAPEIVIRNDGELRTDGALLSGALDTAGTYLVATHTANDFDGIDRHNLTTVDWQSPDLAAVIAVHIRESHRRARTFDQLQASERTFTQQALGTALRAIGGGADVDKTIAELLRTESAEVGNWFNSDPDEALIADIVVIAFLGPLPQSVFERHGRSLQTYLATKSGPDDEPGSGTGLRFQLRHDRRARHRLLHFNKPAAAGYEIVVNFEKTSYREATIAELFDRFEEDVWRRIQSWLESVLSERTVPVKVALSVGRSLAALAGDSTDEVCVNFLRPWSEHDPRTALQAAAVYALWSMCDTDQGATSALMFCRRRLSEGTVNQVWTASMGLSGQVGRSFPTEAIRRLWQLFQSGNPARVYAAPALAQLFVVLEQVQSSSVQIVQQVESAIDATNRPGSDQERRHRVLQAAVDILAARPTSGATPASVHLFQRSVESRALIGRTWSAVLRNRTSRATAIDALLSGLKAAKAAPDLDATAVATALGAATFASMPATSIAAIRAECIIAARRKPRTGEANDANDGDSIEDIIAALWQEDPPEAES